MQNDSIKHEVRGFGSIFDEKALLPSFKLQDRTHIVVKYVKESNRWVVQDILLPIEISEQVAKYSCWQYYKSGPRVFL